VLTPESDIISWMSWYIGCLGCCHCEQT